MVLPRPSPVSGTVFIKPTRCPGTGVLPLPGTTACRDGFLLSVALRARLADAKLGALRSDPAGLDVGPYSGGSATRQRPGLALQEAPKVPGRCLCGWGWGLSCAGQQDRGRQAGWREGTDSGTRCGCARQERGVALRGHPPLQPRPRPTPSSLRGKRRGPGVLMPPLPSPADFILRQRSCEGLEQLWTWLGDSVLDGAEGRGWSRRGAQPGVASRCLGCRRQVGPDLWPKNDGWAWWGLPPEGGKCPPSFCAKDAPADTWMPLPAASVRSLRWAPGKHPPPPPPPNTRREPSCVQTLPEHRAGSPPPAAAQASASWAPASAGAFLAQPLLLTPSLPLLLVGYLNF